MQLRVHLDHLIQRQSIRYISVEKNSSTDAPNQNLIMSMGQEDRTLRYEDIKRVDGWFTYVRKPDFQRETNAWLPDDCLAFLDSVVYGRIIPSIILWRSPESSFIYVLDGAHRLSVLRAWMMDDWGDRTSGYYDRKKDLRDIKKAAVQTRQLVHERIGLFSDFQKSFKTYTAIAEQGKVQRVEMGETKFAQALFYQKVVGGLGTLSVQWEHGDYKSAEQSFLRINRSGQALRPWEAFLIEFRRGSFARSIMCLANGGEPGHYWPSPNEEEKSHNNDLNNIIDSFSEMAKRIYTRLFVPPFNLPIKDLNTPIMVAPAYFQAHKYLIELIPLIVDREILSADEQFVEYLQKDVDSSTNEIVYNAQKLLTTLDQKLEHLVTLNQNSTSLAVVPLFYWYNHKGQFGRALLYGFLYWMLAGTDEDIRNRKLVFSAHRGNFEHLLFFLKSDIATIQERGGAGLKATKRAANFFQAFLELLHDSSEEETDLGLLEEKVFEILLEQARVKKRPAKTSRSFSKSDKSQINIRELFKSSIRCHICGGIINLQSGGVQYDHVEDYAYSRVTDPDTGMPTHPFCNRYKKEILNLRENPKTAILPSLETSILKEEAATAQLSLFGTDDFPI